MCVLYTEEISGVLTLEYDEEGNLDVYKRQGKGSEFFLYLQRGRM